MKWERPFSESFATIYMAIGIIGFLVLLAFGFTG